MIKCATIGQGAALRNIRYDDPELELLVRCCGTGQSRECESRIRELVARCDWSAAMHFALRHRVVPLLYAAVSRIAPEELQRPELAPLVFRARNIAGRNLQLSRELVRLLDVLEAQGIPAIPIKGPLLALGAFGKLAARQFEDLDILVHPVDIHKARDIVRDQGYRPERELTRSEAAAFLRSEHAFQYRRDGCRYVVELHWRLQDRYLAFPFEERDLWETAVQREFMGRQVRCLNGRNLILYLCMHGAKHYWDRLEWISCLAAVIRAERAIDWPALIEQARRMGGMRILQLGILLAHDLDESDRSTAALRLVRPGPIPRELAARVWKQLSASELEGTWREVYRFRFYLNARERLWDRLRVVRFASIRIPHPDSSQWENSEIPSRLQFVYYFLKPARMFRKYGLQGLRGVFRPTGVL